MADPAIHFLPSTSASTVSERESRRVKVPAIHFPASTSKNVTDEKYEAVAKRCSMAGSLEEDVVDDMKLKVEPDWEDDSNIVLSSDDCSNGSYLSFGESTDDSAWSDYANRRVKSEFSTQTPRTDRLPANITAEERRLLRRERNKKAAQRYRLNKKIQAVTASDSEQAHLFENRTLKMKVEDLKREISFMKRQLRILFTAQGLMK